MKMFCKECKKAVEMHELPLNNGYFNGYGCENGHKGKSISNYDLHAYEISCQCCAKTHTLMTQQNRNPEYYTCISLLCKCGELVKFKLPVN